MPNSVECLAYIKENCRAVFLLYEGDVYFIHKPMDLFNSAVFVPESELMFRNQVFSLDRHNSF